MNSMKSNNLQSAKTMNKLSSGKRINQASDDAAGLSISEKMKAQIRGLNQANLNTEQATELIKTSDGAMGEIESSLQRMRELSAQASNGTLTDEDRKAIQAEFTQLSKQIDSTSKNTEFNTIKTIDGSLRNILPTNAITKGNSVSSPILIHDDTPAVIENKYFNVNSHNGIEIHDGKQAFTELNLNSPINISSPNDNFSITYVDENNITHDENLSLGNISISTGTVDQLASLIQIKINGNSDLNNKITVKYSTSPDKIILKSNSSEPNVKVKIDVNYSQDSAINNMIGKPALMIGELKNPITINNGETLRLSYTDSNGIENTQTLTLNSYNSSTTGNHPYDLATMIQNKINGTSLNGKVTVSIDNGKLKLQSKDLGPYASIQIDNYYGASSKIFSDIPLKDKGFLDKSVTLGVTRNDQLKITFKDKTKASNTQFNKDNGFTVSDPEWTEKSFQITIPHTTNSSTVYYNVNELSNAINQAISTEGYDDKISVNYDASGNYGNEYSGKIKFITTNEGENATLKLEDVNNAKGSNMYTFLKVNSSAVNGLDKTDTFAIEVNAQYTERELKDEELSSEDIQKLLNDKILYTPNGYIMEDPLNPCDFIEYTKIQGTGETVQITLSPGGYTKEEFANKIQDAINNKTTQLGNDVTVTADVNGGFSITTSQQNGSKSSIRFVVPTSPPGNESPINTSMDELLKNFLSVTGFDYNRHIGKNGTAGNMNIQVGANSGQQVEVGIDSVRAGALGIKYLDITTVQKASEAISILDKAINKVSTERTKLGAFQNVFEHVSNNLANSSENLTSAQSKIEDADMAKEISTYSKNNILSQAAQAMLAQANQQPQQVLQLLR